MEEKILKCNRCGFCLEVCPTYVISQNEANVARGRVRLARLVCEGNYKWDSDPEIEENIKSCLLCKACVAVCPSTVKTDEIMMEARDKINAAKGFTMFHKLAYRGIFSNQKRFKTASGLARFYQNSGARWLVQGTGILGIAKKLKRMEALLPPLPKKSFFSAGTFINKKNRKAKIQSRILCWLCYKWIF